MQIITKNNNNIINGGLGKMEQKSLGTSNILKFVDNKYINQFREYHFGNEENMNIWLDILNLAKSKKIPVYILTAGDRQGIIRTLQLMEIDNKIERVLSIRQLEGDGIKKDGNTKYEVIKNILLQKGLDRHSKVPIGFLIDDQDYNRANSHLCSSIQFLKVVKKPKHKIQDSYLRRILFNLMGEKPSVHQISYKQLKYIKYMIEIDKIKILFLDFDHTFQIYDGSLPFNLIKNNGLTGLDYMRNGLKKYGVETILINI